MEFRIKIKNYNNGETDFYPQVKTGLLGKLGIWRYFSSLEYSTPRYLVFKKTCIFRCFAVCRHSEEGARECINVFIATVKKIRRLVSVDYKYRVCNSHNEVKYI